MTPDKLLVAALGRPFTIGMLYDAQRDQLIPGVTLWNEKTLREKTQESNQNSSNFQVTASDSTEEKSSLLDVSASLKASFLGGLVEVGGSAKYLNDKKKSFNQSRVTLQYKSTSVFKQLMMTVAEMKKTLKIDDVVKSLATHVVTGILYGANAFFVFDCENLDASSVQKIEGSMEAVIKLIPAFSAEGKVDLKLSEEEKALANKFSCMFYGDFIPDTIPSTFESAVQTFKDLPKLQGIKKENTVPLKVWMMPLKNFDPSCIELKTDIHPKIVINVQDTLENINKLKMRCDDCLEDSYQFSPIRKRLKHFEELCDETIVKIKKILSEKLPSIRAGKEEAHEEIKKLFDNREYDPFCIEKLKLWMKKMEREVTVIKSCVEMMEGARITNEGEFNKETSDPDKDVLCFVFTSLETTDPSLQEMLDNLRSLDSKSTKTDVPPPADPWFDPVEIKNMTQKAKMFGDIAKALKNNSEKSRYRCLVGTIENKEIKGASIYQYRNGELVTEDFCKPPVQIVNRRDLIWYAVDLTLDLDTAHPEVILSNGNKKATHGDAQQYLDFPQRFDELPQVLCKEKLSGRHYWEVELSTEKGSDAAADADVAAGVCYGKMERKGKGSNSRIGFNENSWAIEFSYPDHQSPTFTARDNNRPITIGVPQTGCPRLGVYLDYPEATLSYYIVTGDKLSLLEFLYTKFTEPVYPCFMVLNKNNHISLCVNSEPPDSGNIKFFKTK